MYHCHEPCHAYLERYHEDDRMMIVMVLMRMMDDDDDSDGGDGGDDDDDDDKGHDDDAYDDYGNSDGEVSLPYSEFTINHANIYICIKSLTSSPSETRQ